MGWAHAWVGHMHGLGTCMGGAHAWVSVPVIGG